MNEVNGVEFTGSHHHQYAIIPTLSDRKLAETIADVVPWDDDLELREALQAVMDARHPDLGGSRFGEFRD